MILFGREHIDILEWRTLLESSSFSSVFQSPECYDFFESSGYFNPFVIAYRDDVNGSLLALISGTIQCDGNAVMRFFSRRAIIYGGPLIAKDVTVSVLHTLLNELKSRLSGRAIYLEVRNFLDYSEYRDAFLSAGFSHLPYLGYIIDTSTNDVFSRIQRRKREQISSALRRGVSICDNPSVADIEAFYRILCHLHRYKTRTPVPPISFFLSLAGSSVGRVILMKNADGIVISGSAVMFLPDGTLYHFYVAGDDCSFKFLFPSTMAHWSIIKYSVEHNIAHCDLMGAGLPGIHDNLIAFKRKWGGAITTADRFLYPLDKLQYNIGKFAVSIFRKL
ncbi:MAG: peptidoglycan bridge formation glycyltransferase FemA/FemB family protein [Paludibacteraceae bacterium]|nr:peptidoglycan bridge formation glycyltransferase FemA/FemB family protein [Paludibacteraceae bacterium]